MPIPCMETGRCYISSKGHDARLGSGPNGNIFITKNRKEWEEWFVQIKTNGQITLKSVKHGHFLLAEVSGKLNVNRDEITGSSWCIESSSHGGFFLKSPLNDKKMACDGNVVYTVSGQSGSWESWEFEFLSGELCFISSPAFDKRLKCEPSGNLSPASHWKGWEVWRFIEVGGGDVIITSWTHSKKVICSNPDGHVYTTENKLGSWERWRIEKDLSANAVVIISTTHGKKLGSNGKHFFTTSMPKDNESIIWHLEAAHRETYYLSSLCYDKRIGASKDEVFTTSNRKSWEQWKLTRKGGDNRLVTCWSEVHKKYLGSNQSGNLFLSDKTDEDEEWILKESPYGGYFLCSNTHSRFLTCDETHGHPCTVENLCDKEGTWLLEPCMPPTISGPQIWTMASGGVAAIALTVSMPFIVMGVIGGMGFMAGGITAGSMAAGMMSAEAIAAGGGVVAGGTVATLQSIGAAGLGIGGTVAAIGCGALIGGSVAGTTSAVALSFKKGVGVVEGSGRDHNVKRTNQNFCDWRNW